MSAASVSVIVPARDAERYLGEAIATILGQTRPPAEVIVVDDGSRDGTAAVARSFPEITLVSQEPTGIGAALNAGLRRASGELLAFLDADDLWTERKLELQADVLAADATLDMVFGHAEEFLSPELTPSQRGALRPPAGPTPAKLKATMLVRRASAARVGPFGTSFEVGDFLDWSLRAQEAGLREEMIDELILRRRLHLANTGRIRAHARREYAQVIAQARGRRRQADQRSSS
jgi:glycosyltransferase involved in cell wall biosynthesis